MCDCLRCREAEMLTAIRMDFMDDEIICELLARLKYNDP